MSYIYILPWRIDSTAQVLILRIEIRPINFSHLRNKIFTRSAVTKTQNKTKDKKKQSFKSLNNLQEDKILVDFVCRVK